MNKDRLKAEGCQRKLKVKGVLRISLTTVLLLYLQGCVTVTSDYDTLKSDVNMLKKDIYETKVSLQELKKQVDEIALIARQGGTEQAKALTESQVTLFNKLNTITAELTDIRARFEEQRHFVEKNLNELKQADERGQSKIENIEITMRDLQKRIDGLESQIKAFRSTFTSPPTVTPSTEQRELPPSASAASGTPQPAQTARPATPSQTQTPAQPETPPTVTSPQGTVTSPPKGTDEPKVLYDRARELFKEKKYGEARALFEEFIKKYPDYRLAGNCRFWIAESYYAEKNYEDAILNYEKVIKDYPSNEKVPSAYLKQAYAFIELGDKKTGKVILQKLIEKFPGTEEAKAAKEKLAEMGKKKR